MILGIGNKTTANHRSKGPESIPPSTSLPFDTFTVPRAGFSTRKIRSAYFGPCMQVRDVNNNLFDINFTSSGVLDEDAINTIAANAGGNDDVTVFTWYDQSGNGNNMVMNAVADQPIIWSKGTLSGLPSQSGIIKSANGVGPPGGWDEFPGLWFWYDGSNSARFELGLGDPSSGQPGIGANQSFGVDPGIFAMVYQPNTGPSCGGSTMSIMGKPGSGNISVYHPIAQSTNTSVEVFRGLRTNGAEDAPLNPPGLYFDGVDETANIIGRQAAHQRYLTTNGCTPQKNFLYVYSSKNMTWNTTSHAAANRWIQLFGEAGSSSWSIKSIVNEVLFFDQNSDNNNILDEDLIAYYKTPF